MNGVKLDADLMYISFCYTVQQCIRTGSSIGQMVVLVPLIRHYCRGYQYAANERYFWMSQKSSPTEQQQSDIFGYIKKESFQSRIVHFSEFSAGPHSLLGFCLSILMKQKTYFFVL